LIVDDNEDAASMLSEYLQVLGHETRVCLDGPSALAVVAGFEPDIGLVDLGLPLMDGFELAQELKVRIPHCRLIAVSGYGQDSDLEKSRQAGFEHHLVKPVSLGNIRALLERQPPRN
jgi:CheY-like chemotaxis protein